jgi:hypothetical protein
MISMAKGVPGKDPAKAKQLGSIMVFTMTITKASKHTSNTIVLMNSKLKQKAYPPHSMTGLQSSRKYVTMNGLKAAQPSVRAVEQEKKLFI